MTEFMAGQIVSVRAEVKTEYACKNKEGWELHKEGHVSFMCRREFAEPRRCGINRKIGAYMGIVIETEHYLVHEIAYGPRAGQRFLALPEDIKAV